MAPNPSTVQSNAVSDTITPCVKPRRLDGHVVISGDWHLCLVVQELIASCARTYDFDDFGVRKAVKEALANALKHGNGGSPQKCICVDYEVDETDFRVSITDEGPGFKPEIAALACPQPHDQPAGRGLSLIQHYMTEVHFNEAGNRVELSKHKQRCQNRCY
jgi:hypothetical protein